MGKRRELQWNGSVFTLTALARAHDMSPATLADRLDRQGLPLPRALATGYVTGQRRARQASRASFWRRV